MSKRIRAKFQCQSETKTHWSEDARTVKFAPMYDQKLAEDRSFAKSTPSGSLEILVDNPDVHFKLGKFYYLDLTEIEDDK